LVESKSKLGLDHERRKDLKEPHPVKIIFTTRPEAGFKIKNFRKTTRRSSLHLKEIKWEKSVIECKIK